MYNISKGQLWVVIVGSFCLWVFFLEESSSYSSDWWGGLGSVVTPILLVFYILGWKNYKKKLGEDHKLFGGLLSKVFSIVKKSIIPVIILVTGLGGLYWFIDKSEGGGRVDGLENVRQSQVDEYVGRFNRMSKHIENAQQCMQNLVDKQLGPKKEACEEKYDSAYAKFQNCRNSYSTFSRYDCLNTYGANYEVIDCSDDTLTEEIKSQDFMCYSTVSSEHGYIISFEERLIDDYLDDLPASKYSLSTSEMQDLYSKIPESVFNDKTKERFDAYVESKGYLIE